MRSGSYHFFFSLFLNYKSNLAYSACTFLSSPFSILYSLGPDSFDWKCLAGGEITNLGPPLCHPRLVESGAVLRNKAIGAGLLTYLLGLLLREERLPSFILTA